MMPKFRAWLKHTNEMVDVLSIDFQNEEILYKKDNDFCNADDGTSLVKGVAPFKYIELMQFTGLYDKNGTDIYEGDVVKEITTYNYAVNRKVNIKEKTVVKYDSLKLRYSIMPHPFITFEVVGNIYENKEMIE